MELTPRLKAVADTVTKGNRVADVGCDHAYISIYLVEQNIGSKIIATDVNKGPLERANENIRRFGKKDVIQTRLSNGLEKIEPGEVDTVLIAGMGGALVVRILEEGARVVDECKELVLQPQSEFFLVRKYLHSIGFFIQTEHMLIDDGKYYVVIRAVKGDKVIPYDKEVFYVYGKCLLEQKGDVLKEYLQREYGLKMQVIKDLEKITSEKVKIRQEEVQQEIKYIEEALSYCCNL